MMEVITRTWTALLEDPWPAVAGAYVLVGCIVVFWLHERLRRRRTPRHELAGAQHRLTGFDVWLIGLSSFPPLWLLMIPLWPLWAVCVWASDADEDE